MTTIRLQYGKWDYDPHSRLGPPGGFGEVFAGTGENSEQVAVKRLHLSANDAAHRELQISNTLLRRELKYVMPILDSGKDADSDHYFVIMPRAEKSLQQELSRVGFFDVRESIAILMSIANGLVEVRDIVHRDLKPGNVLYHEGRWKIADFGIARFVEESTSLNTLKDCLSPQYAAPEQWLQEHAIGATDVYALGCLAYALLMGKPPFSGTTKEDYKKQHLQQDPPPLKDEIPPRLRSLVLTMLRKPTSARPSLDRIINVLNDLSSSSLDQNRRPGFINLAVAGAKDAEVVLRSDAAKTLENQKRQKREELAVIGFQILEQLAAELAERIRNEAPTVQIAPIRNRSQVMQIQFGTASLTIEALNNRRIIDEDTFKKVSWDVVAGAIISVEQKERTTYLWSANLWYTNLGKGSEYRWWEALYMTHPLIRSSNRWEPYALNMEQVSDTDQRFSLQNETVQLAAKPRTVDDEDVDNFCERWADLLAKAYKGEITRPTHLPLS